MKNFLIYFLILSALFCRADHLFVGIMEIENCRELELSFTALEGVTRIQKINDIYKTRGTQLTALPEMKGFETGKRLRIIQTVDPDEPLSDINPANIAILYTRDGGKAIEDMLESSYRRRSYWRSKINIYDKPYTTNVVPEMAYMQEGQYILTSLNKNALYWISQNKKLLNAAPLNKKGDLQILLNPQRAAAVLNAKGYPQLLQIFKPAEMLQELESCIMGITIEPQMVTISADVKPLEGTPMATMAANMKKPEKSIPDITPKDALLQSISCCGTPEIWNRFAPNLQNYVIPAFNEIDHIELFTGKRTQYLVPASKTKGLIFVQSDNIKNKVKVAETIDSLETFMPKDSNVVLKKEISDSQVDFTRYKILLKENSKTNEQSSVYYKIASLFLQHAWLEMKIVNDDLISAIGPKNSLSEVLGMNSQKKEISLLNEISARNKELPDNILCGTKVRISQALRDTAAIIPKVTKEQLEILPEAGYGITFGLDKIDDEKLTVSLQITADEIAALSRIGTDIRDLMQTLLVSILMERIESSNISQPLNDQK